MVKAVKNQTVGAAGYGLPRTYVLGQVSNNARSRLVAAISDTDTDIPISGDDAGIFPALSAGEWFPATLYDGEFREIIYVTGRKGGLLTVKRGQENTQARQWAPQTPIDARLTKGLWDELAYAADGHHRHKTTDIDGIDDFASLSKSNAFGGKATFNSLEGTQFNGDVAINGGHNLNVSGTANFGGNVSFNGAITAQQGAGGWQVIEFRINDGTARAGGLRWHSPNAVAAEFGYKGNGGVYFWREGVGDYFTIDPDGNFSSMRANSLFGRGGMVLDVIKSYIEDYVRNNSVQEMKTSGYQQIGGYPPTHTEFTGNPRVITFAAGGSYVDKMGTRDLLYRVGNDWRSPWIG